MILDSDNRIIVIMAPPIPHPLLNYNQVSHILDATKAQQPWVKQPRERDGPRVTSAHRMTTMTLRTAWRKVRKLRLRGRRGIWGFAPLSRASGPSW